MWSRIDRRALRVVGSVAFVAAVLAFVPLAELIAPLGRLPAWVWLAAVAAHLLSRLAAVEKWRLLLRAARTDLGWRRAAHCYYAGQFANTFLPSLVGGDVVRTGLAMRASASPGGTLLASVVDRYFDFVALGAVAAAGAWLAPPEVRGDALTALRWAVALLGTAAVAATFILLRLPPERLPRRLDALVRDARDAFQAIVRDPARGLGAFALAILLQLFLVAIAAVLSSLLGFEVPALVWILVFSVGKLAALAPISIGGIGVREAA
ncbi:MAG TPA: lysylphosphatidylglycerol synthase transmembrane domain-containing protein, partial [Thermoanaerobaculia bacterium]|nr:lysylphosphatidylglycerol synthase transmembrane domain-containing protein [Thermoanaerobaculia bacterium]